MSEDPKNGDPKSVNQMGQDQPAENPPSKEAQEAQEAQVRYSHHMLWLSGIVGAVLGAVLCAALIFRVVLPARMILTYESRLGFDETAAALESAIPKAGWSVSSVTDLCAGGVDPNLGLRPRIRLVSMCKAEYVNTVLSSDPQIAAIMPCTFAVWEAKDGKPHISVMNTTVMARLFGGRVGDVMGRRVAWDEKIILGDIIKGQRGL
ncbi:MAG: DUF302 domain-containing protein [Sedimentisphaerales bacterium]|nr:DUF302 domain-containing protein [Sedimentisphaerales bacterium]